MTDRTGDILSPPTLLARQAYEAIRALVARQGYDPAGPTGLRLVERDLARELSMSRTPVREALRRLTLAGFLVRSPGGTYVPRRLTRRDVDDHYDLRILFEAQTAALVAGQCRRGKNDKTALLERLRQTKAEGSFHELVAEMCGSWALREAVAVLIEHPASQWAINREAGGGDHGSPHVGHGRVIWAIEQGEGEEAAVAMQCHLEFLRDSFAMRKHETAVG
jgi:DNA-binding GntR family transcriptional regulator